jgi:hypothetical protein
MQYWENKKLLFWIGILALASTILVPFVFKILYPPKARIITEGKATIITPNKTITIESPAGPVTTDIQMKAPASPMDNIK